MEEHEPKHRKTSFEEPFELLPNDILKIVFANICNTGYDTPSETNEHMLLFNLRLICTKWKDLIDELAGNAINIMIISPFRRDVRFEIRSFCKKSIYHMLVIHVTLFNLKIFIS